MTQDSRPALIGRLVTITTTIVCCSVAGAHLHEQAVSELRAESQKLNIQSETQQQKITTLEADVKARDLLIQGMLMNK